MKIIHNTGPWPCDVLIVAERPGIEEARRGTVLCGPSGQELDRYLLNEAGRDRATIRCCNLVVDYRDGENPDEWEVVRDWPLVIEEVQRTQPKYVMALGSWSTRAFLGYGFELDWCNGLHFPLEWECCKFTIMPVVHTAAGLHQPNIAGKIAHGFRQFGKLVRGETLPTGHWCDVYSKPQYKESAGGWQSTRVAVDTEGSVERPWCLSSSDEPGRARVVRHPKGDKIDFAILHNAIHDLPVLDALGVKYGPITDTMLMAALLGVEPLGLKSLARRHCGMLMSDYSSIVAPARREKALDYLGRVLAWAAEETERLETSTRGATTAETRSATGDMHAGTMRKLRQGR